MPRIFAFTGIPGVGLHPHVVKAATSIEKRLGKAILTISLDWTVWEVFSEAARSNHVLLGEVGLSAREVEPNSKPNWWRFLRLPVELIRRYWQVAAERALKQIEASTHDFVLVSFHACYQGDYYRYRIAAANPDYS